MDTENAWTDKFSLMGLITGMYIAGWIVFGGIISFYVKSQTADPKMKSSYFK